ncbi:DUF2839 domain-containing protein [Thermostichus vulcanus]|uniref:DUF2839 domain-containing protein n=1 Tax=Thermostichus vulcanus str. 'Rupite' TaxID=2813851 RepID=A0ABT0C874_THEVL|nr:DUF2839 domain-containing protein [Thermostichus vulcanus]MCJ2541996.1 DUF2839 domain-containing protein [Thermostichus vulcanus str. 'Rupite']
MGEAKRRKTRETQDPDQELVFPKLKDIPLTKGQARTIYNWTTRGAWTGIILLAIVWVVIRFVGPTFGWWHLVG